MGALLVLSLKSNELRADGGKALAEGLRGNSVIEELNIADNVLTDYDGTDMSGVVAIADVIPGMGALSTISFGDNDSTYIKKQECVGSSFNVGDSVEYQGQTRIVAKGVDSDGELKVKGVVTLDIKMTQANLCSMNIGVPGAIIVSAFLPKCG
jgi:hypothetical protein